MKRNKLWTIVVALFLLLLAMFINCANGQETDNTEPSVYSDEHASIILDKLVRTYKWPSEISENGYGAFRLPEDYNYFCIYLTIDHLENVYITNLFGYGDEECILTDKEDYVYDLAYKQGFGLQCIDTQDIRSCVYVEGATAILIFSIPYNAILTKFNFVYSFKETWQDTYAQRGQIDIDF